MIKAFIFDFFGVIGASTYQLIAEKIDVHNSDQLTAISDLHKSLDNGFVTQEDFLHQYAQIANLSYEDFLQIYHNSNTRFSVSEKLIEYIGDLKKEGYKIGLLSNVNKEAFEEFVKPIVVQHNYFDAVMPSFQTGLVKPSSTAFLEMSNKLQVAPEECLMVDDLELNCLSAQSAGLKAIIYRNYHQFRLELNKNSYLEKS
jgi:HAD superfamily hydrolase (TIGR01509 family)